MIGVPQSPEIKSGGEYLLHANQTVTSDLTDQGIGLSTKQFLGTQTLMTNIGLQNQKDKGTNTIILKSGVGFSFNQDKHIQGEFQMHQRTSEGGNIQRNREARANFSFKKQYDGFLFTGTGGVTYKKYFESSIIPSLQKSEGFTQLSSICGELNMQLHNDQAAFIAKRGSQRKNGGLSSSMLKLTGAYRYKERQCEGNFNRENHAGENKTTGEASVSYKHKIITGKASIIYDGKQFIPNFTISKGF